MPPAPGSSRCLKGRRWKVSETKRAAELERGDGVRLFNRTESRVVEKVEFRDKPIDTNGTTGVKVWWYGRTNPSLIAADKEMETY